MRCLACFLLFLILGCTQQQNRVTALRDRSQMQIRIHKELATPEWIQGPLLDLQGIKEKKHVEMIMQFMAANQELFKLQHPSQDLQLQKNETDELGFQHLRFSRMFEKIPVWNDDLAIHINKEKKWYLFNGQYHGHSLQAGRFVLTTDQAQEIALTAGQEKKLTRVEETQPVWYPVAGALRPAYHLVLTNATLRWDYFIAADNGDILYKQDRRRS